MTIESDNFEKQVKRIHEVLVQDHGKVTWNDKIPDPDNPKKTRQIDITVRINNEIIHIECRHHKDKQNVKWVEELVGRKISLEATAMIGVSSSGFTEGAIKKAKKLGIFLCNLNQLTETEVKSWGKKTKIKFLYYKFSNLEICHFLESIKGISSEEIQKDIFSKPEYYDILFNQIKYKLTENKDFIYPYGFQFNNITGGNIEILKRPIISISVRGDVDKVGYDYECPSFFSFKPPVQVAQPLASIEKNETPGLEIIKSSSGFATVSIDLSIAPQAPPNSVFTGIEFSKLPGSKNYPPKFNVIGSHEQQVYINEAQFVIAEVKKTTI
ncbi:MAG TPA: hypothetical protein ENH23_03385 [candidate division Zixibacteria bacterium]|nr:hypothetical protein [candidate division Zixibacteria bacterium]